MENLRLNDMPYIPKSISIPSSHIKVAGVGGIQFLQYRFKKGSTVEVDDAADRKMLLGLKRRVPGPGGIGSMEIPLLVAATGSERVAAMSVEEKLDRLLALLEDKGISAETMLGESEPAVTEPDSVDDDL